jgi:2-dehydro-3-deoxygalactonokinase
MLARSLPPGDDDAAWRPQAFDAGIERAQRPGGLLHHLFGVRTLSLFDRRDAADLASYLSGLVIGDELRAQLPAGDDELVIVGAPALVQRYRRALQASGRRVQALGGEASWRGLIEIARAAGLGRAGATT